VKQPQPYFHFVSLSPGGAVPISNAWVIVDTSVLSVLEAMAWRGYQPQDVQQQRAAHFLRWLRRYDVDLVNTSFAVVEGAGFHTGGVRDYDVQKRYLPFEALRVLDETRLEEFLDSGDGVFTAMPADDAERYLTEVVADVTEMLPTIFGPAYLVVLHLWLCKDAGMDMVATCHSVMSLLADKLNFVPALPWAVTLLRCFAQPSVRRDLVQDVFKFDEPARRRSPQERATRVQSAAWDLTYLEFLNRQRRQLDDAPPGLTAAQAMVLVTDDRGLARLGALFSGSYQSNLSVSPDILDGAAGNAAFDEAQEAMRRKRQSVTPAAPDVELVRQLAAGLEAQLGIPSLSLTVRPSGKSVSPSVPLMRELLRALDGWEGADLLERLARVRREHPGDLLYAALAALQLLADDNARARSRTGVGSLQDIVGRLRERAGQPPRLPTLGERLAAAWVRRDNFSANSLLWQVEVVDTGLYGLILGSVSSGARWFGCLYGRRQRRPRGRRRPPAGWRRSGCGAPAPQPPPDTN